MTDWERQWRGAGVVFVFLTIVAFVIYGDQPKLGAPPAELLSFYHGDRNQILVATVIFCFACLCPDRANRPVRVDFGAQRLSRDAESLDRARPRARCRTYGIAHALAARITVPRYLIT